MDRRVLIRRLLFAAYFIAAFLLFLYLRLPYDSIKSRLEAEVRNRTPLELSISRLSPRFFDLAMRDVIISDKTGRVLFESPIVYLDISFLGLIRGIISFRADMEAYGGEIVLKVRKDKNSNALSLDADGMDIGTYPLFKDTGMELSGRLGGSFDMSGQNGKGRLWLRNLAWRGVKVNGFPIPDIDLDQCWLEAELKGDRLLIKKLEAEGKELKARIFGDMVLRQQGAMNLTIKLKPSERIAREQSVLFSLLKNRDSEGFFQFSIGGTLSAPMPRL